MTNTHERLMRRPPAHELKARKGLEKLRRRTRAHRPICERLDSRLLLAADITSFDLTAGTITFSGDQNATTADTLTLSEVTVNVAGGGTETRLAHDLLGNGGTGDYADATDIDPSSGIAHLVIGSGSAPLITVNLGAGNDNLVLDSSWTFAHEVAFDGGSGADTVTGPDAANTWSITGPGAGNLNGASALAFSSVEVLQGGADSDTLTGEDVASTWSLADTQTYDDGTAVLTFSNFENLQGGSAVDTFHIDGDSALGMVTANLKGGAGDDVFALSGFALLTGSLDGQGGSDVLDYSGFGSSVNVILAGPATTDGYAGAEFSSIGGGFLGIDVLTGSLGEDVLTGEDVASTWSLGATQTYKDNSVSNTLTFSSFEALQGGTAVDSFNVSADPGADLFGGAGDDTFAFADGIATTGIIDGEAGSDTLALDAYTTAVSETLTGSNTTGFTGTGTGTGTGGFFGIDAITAGSGANTLTGENVVSTWDLSGAPTYSDGSNSLSLTTFQTLQGGTAADIFSISAATVATLQGGDGDDVFDFTADSGVLTGRIDGQDGTDTLVYSGYSSAVTVTLLSGDFNGLAGTATSVSGGFGGIDRAQGGSAADTLIGENIDSTWTLDAVVTYSDGLNTLTLLSFETLQGGAGMDEFAILASQAVNLKGGDDADRFLFMVDGVALDGTIDGGNGIDQIDYSALATAITVNLAAASATGTIGMTNVEDLVGGSGSNSLIGANMSNTWDITDNDAGSVTNSLGDTFSFASIANLSGGVLNDTFAFADGVGVTGTIKGGSGTDTLSFASYAAGHGVSASVSTNNGGNITASGVAFSFSAMENVTGGAGDDTFSFGNGKTLSGRIIGGGGVNTLDYSAYTTGVRVNLASGAATGIKAGASGGIIGIVNVTGGSGNDILTGDGAANVLNGNAGNDILVGAGGDDTISGGDGRDILIGGNGADSLDGGADDDLLIGGRTSYDNNLAALNALMAEWGRTDVDYATRIGHLDGSLARGRNGSILLNAANVFDDAGAVDSMTGGLDQDWFIAFLNDLVIDLNAGATETKSNR